MLLEWHWEFLISRFDVNLVIPPLLPNWNDKQPATVLLIHWQFLLCYRISSYLMVSSPLGINIKMIQMFLTNAWKSIRYMVGRCSGRSISFIFPRLQLNDHQIIIQAHSILHSQKQKDDKRLLYQPIFFINHTNAI